MFNRFKVGDCIIALTDSKDGNSQLRVKGETYVVHHTMNCSLCKSQNINLGLLSEPVTEMVKCKCGRVVHNLNKAWTHHSHFCKREELYPNLVRAVEAEEYEIADSIREIIEQQTLNFLLTVGRFDKFYRNQRK